MIVCYTTSFLRECEISSEMLQSMVTKVVFFSSYKCSNDIMYDYSEKF